MTVAGTRAACTVTAVLALAACSAGGGTPAGAPATRQSAPVPPGTAGASTPAPTPSAGSVSPSGPGGSPGSPRRLVVRTVPEGATVEVVDAGGARQHGRTGRTAYTAVVRGARVTLTVRRAGYNGVRRSVVVGRGRVMTVWLDKSGQLLSTLNRWKAGSNPKQVAFTPDGREVWASLLGGKGVQVYDAVTGRRRQEIRLGSHGAVEVMFSRDGRTAYASQMETASVFVIDTASRRVRKQIKGGGSWSKVMALSPDERMLYLANWSSNDVSEIDLTVGKVRRRIKTVATPRGLYVSPNARMLYVAGYDDGELQVIDLRTRKRKTLLRTGGAMRHLVGDPRSMRLYADDMAKDVVYVVDLRTNRVRTLAKVDHLPNTIDLSPDGRVLYVSCRGKNGPNYYLPGPEWGSVVLVDTRTGRLLDAIVGGNQTTGLDVSGDGRRLAFSDFLDNRISVYTIPPYRLLTAGDGGRVSAHRRELGKR